MPTNIVREGQKAIGLGRSASEQKSGVGEWLDSGYPLRLLWDTVKKWYLLGIFSK